MKFRYRFVDYGTRFEDREGDRPPAPLAGEDERDFARALYRNELVLDVGSVCWGYNGVAQCVLDHHFFREDGGNFPSAAAAVLHKAGVIHSHFRDTHPDTFWLVTHREPDFDAFCAMFLARELLEGRLPAGGWEEFGIHEDAWLPDRRGDIAWFRPPVARLPEERRWPILLACYAANVDNCRRLVCPKHRALHSVLYAALVRGRPYLGETGGAVEFFEQAVTAVRAGLNPLTDSVLEGNPLFAPELAFLDRQLDAYQRDVRRARRAIVFLEQAAPRTAFPDWFGHIESPECGGLPRLRNPDGSISPAHFTPPGHADRRAQADGIYIRDPECVLFKEWARLDKENSSMGEGFLFTAVAYSAGRPNAPANRTDYYFSLDPERANGADLYDVWARLQAADIRARPAPGQGGPCRIGFECRAGRPPGANDPWFDDPWFDGHNYGCTIIVTPNRGTAVGPAGQRGDLADDPVANTVRQQLEFLSVFRPLDEKDPGPTVVLDDVSPDRRQPRPDSVLDLPRRTLEDPEPVRGDQYRLATVPLRDGVDLYEGEVARQVAATLWPHLEPSVPFEAALAEKPERLILGPDWVGVWGTHGVAVAYRPAAQAVVEGAPGAPGLRERFRDLVGLAGALQNLVEAAPARPAGNGDRPADPEAEQRLLARGRKLTEQVASLRYYLASPNGVLLRGFFEASGLERVLDGIVQTHQAATLTGNVDEIAEVQSHLRWVEMFLIAVYAVELTSHIGESFRFPHRFVGWWLLAAAGTALALSFVYLRPRNWHWRGVVFGLTALLILTGYLLWGLSKPEGAREAVEPPAAGTKIEQIPVPREEPPAGRPAKVGMDRPGKDQTRGAPGVPSA